MKKRIAISLLMIVFMAAMAALAAFLLYNGYIRFNYPSFTQYPIQGIDVSNHQKVIDWQTLDKKYVQFAFIKATEGGDFKDKSFLRNWENAKKQGIIVGAYHFFTFCKSPEEQAQNFIQSVPNEEGMLPPAIDLEYSGNCKLTKTKEALLCDIESFISIIEKHYQRRMVIYVTEDFYGDVLAGKLTENYFWVRDIYTQPKTVDNRAWLFWQHSNRGRLTGIDGFVDLNVFRGTEADFENLLTYRMER